MKRIRAIGLILLTAVIMLFAGQNLHSVEVTLLAWTFNVTAALIALVPLLAGLLVGAGSAITARYRGRRKEREKLRERESREAEPPEGAAEEVPEAALAGGGEPALPAGDVLEGSGDQPDEVLEDRPDRGSR